MDRFAHILFRTDDDCEYDEDDGRVEVVQAVDPVVIIAAFQPSIGCKTPQYAVKPETIAIFVLTQGRHTDFLILINWVSLLPI